MVVEIFSDRGTRMKADDSFDFDDGDSTSSSQEFTEQFSLRGTGHESIRNTAKNTTSSEEEKPQAYSGVTSYLKDYLALLSLKLHREVELMRALRGDDRQESFLGLFVSDSDIAAILSELHGRLLEDFPEGEALQEKIDAQLSLIQNRLQLTKDRLPDECLQQIFHLQRHEIELLMLALAPEIDSRFSKVYGYLHDDVGRKYLSAALADKLIATDDYRNSRMRESLHHDSALIKFGLITLLDDDNTPLINRGIKIENRLVNYLLDIRQTDDELADYLQPPWFGKFNLSKDETTHSASVAVERWQAEPLPLVIKMSPKADIDLWLSLFCGQANMGLICIDWKKLQMLEINKAMRLLVKVVREGHLTTSLVHIHHVDTSKTQLIDKLMSLATPLVCISSTEEFVLEKYNMTAHQIELPELSLDNRVACWRAEIPEELGISDLQLEKFAARYQLSVRSISALLQGVQMIHGIVPVEPLELSEPVKQSEHSEDFLQQLTAACRQRVGDKMKDVAQRVVTPFHFGDLVLPKSTMQLLEELIDRQANSARVLDSWGLGDLFHQSSGSAVLFVGPSGTGKTMAASVISNELGLDMYRVDLSGVVSKYIGETEKNLERIFTVAAQSQVVLFIDEADALFGKRSEVKDAHDRYANIEVSYLLQKMEDHKGIVILASNFGQNIDDAFFRRFSSVMEFSLPKADERLKLWQKLERADAPVAENVDLSFLAKQLDITGGHIKNCILNAAFQAASQNEAISMQMLIRAVGREYIKVGKPISRNNFGEYYAGLRREAIG